MYLLLGNRNILAKPALFEFGVSGLEAGGHAKENLFQKSLETGETTKPPEPSNLLTFQPFETSRKLEMVQSSQEDRCPHLYYLYDIAHQLDR